MRLLFFYSYKLFHREAHQCRIKCSIRNRIHGLTEVRMIVLIEVHIYIWKLKDENATTK